MTVREFAQVSDNEVFYVIEKRNFRYEYIKVNYKEDFETLSDAILRREFYGDAEIVFVRYNKFIGMIQVNATYNN